MRIFIYKCDKCDFTKTVLLYADFKVATDILTTIRHLELCPDCVDKLMGSTLKDPFNSDGTFRTLNYVKKKKP